MALKVRVQKSDAAGQFLPEQDITPLSPALVSRPPKTSRRHALRPEHPEYLLRPRSFAGSVAIHVSVVTALFVLPAMQYHGPDRSAYEQLILPDAHKLVWYNFPKKLPDVDAPERIGLFPKPVGAHRAEVSIIATSPKPKSEKQIIWQPVPKVEIRQDLPAPNLIARAATAIPAPTPPPPHRKFQAPQLNAEGVKAPQPNPTPPEIKGDVAHAALNVAEIQLPKLHRTFVAPQASDRQAKLPLPIKPSDLPVPDASIAGTAPTKAVLPDGLGAAALSKGGPPPPNAPPGTENNAGNAKVDVAIASINDKPGPIPDGSRPGQFSQSPLVGDIATGDVTGNGLTVPHLTIRDDRTKVDAPHMDPGRKTILYADRVRSVPVSTLSVPLRPASRTIPRAIEARFVGRNVYTMVVPIENIAPYSGDWILWFAERQTRTGETPFVRAPVPMRKFESVQPLLPGARSEFRVQFAAVINKEGKMDSLALLRSVNPVLDQLVLQDLAAWEFKPATRDGTPVDVDVVLEVPFVLPTQIAKGAQP